MKIRRIAAADLDDGLKTRWRQLRSAERSLDSPYFSVEYTQAAGEVLDDVFVGVMEDGGDVQGFFPYQLKSRRVAGPVGGRLADWQGPITSGDLDWDPATVLRGCGVDIWDFDHVPQSQRAFQAHVTAGDVSPIMELTGGFVHYLAVRRAAGSQRVSQIQRKFRRFEREVGPLRFELDCRDRRAFDRIVQWKREQCLRTGTPDFLSWGWTTALLERIWAFDTPEFAGRLSVLSHDEAIVAAHYGMHSATVWHWWFPTYNKAYADYSPGGVLLLRLAEAAASSGMHHIDLGKGDDPYKQSFATGEIPLVEGCVLVPSLASSLRRARRVAQGLVKRSPALNLAWTTLRPLRDWLSRRSRAERSATA